MLTWAMKKIFGTSHDRAIRRMRPKVEAIGALEKDLKKLSDAELQAKTAEFKTKLDNGAKLDDILIPAFAVCREASRRVLRMRHYDVQLIGGMVLHQGSIAEMRTGEGKTLVATLPCYLNALEGKGVHVITVNDYLAKRDAEWMGRLYGALGLSTGVVVNQQNDADKRHAYRCDITYGQNNEFGFDYLRDNMKFSALDYHQRPLNYAIVDEVDSILIDEARTPLIISGQGERSSDKYRVINDVIPRLRNEEHYNVDEKGHSVTLTDDGVELAEKLLEAIGVLKSKNLYDPVNLETLHILNQCLRAHSLYKRDVNYLVKEGKVLIVDEFTGRVLAGRRWSDGLHQAVEAKENVRIQEESRTMATITFQNLFRIYKKLSGMTGTADTEASEFHSTYKLDVVIIPTNKNIIRTDYEDVVYKTEREKFTAVVNEIIEKNEKGQPILVGTTSVEKSAAIAKILGKKGIKHSVLNAKQHENEAFIVAQAGRKGAITVSTNMAGRGTDILLGGNPEMLAKLRFKEQNRLPEAEPEAFDELVDQIRKECEAEGNEVREIGGLYIIGTERHESRRIDNQLRGRAGRQGDPGMSRFYLSLEDDLMRIFAGDRVKNLMEKMGMPDDEPIEHPWVTKSVENAQKKVEERNFDIRKNLLEYDDVMNAQRKTIYDIRQQLLVGRYSPDIVDEEGKATGEKRTIKPLPRIVEDVVPDIGYLLGMFAADPISPRDKEGNPRTLSRKDFEKVEKFVETDNLQKELYTRYGVKIDFESREDAGVEIYDECIDIIPRALTEQRERFLDLMDRIIGAMVEENCPPRKPPEDWDWGGIFQGFREHFGIELPDEIAEHAEAEHLAHDLFDRAEKAFEAREKEIGTELLLRIFRHIYLEELDKSWVDHLTDMDHLRDGIGLRGYGQKDPKQEYKKEGYNLFVTMVARVQSNVMTKVFAMKVRREEEEQAIEEQDLARHQAQLDHAVAHHAEELPPGASEEPPPQEPIVTAEMECPCGSGKPFMQCHGAEDEASV
ncbi:preprotein translocase subunit SecA [Polyangium jinanense]|uniref:Protein translocase subunit SecA n=1 Tax=Polyangium jinanense TaxID=2829994 RepID=A0A9X3WWC9_9BACT|nr:preprotein translocase subunit SecA [Polyangium jinanense]MDC3953557.1 preprotein translocase subunit SecA [Polyangium jinanense]MDC3979322.1 preprotein translocase subunit SecA [Polyangium jinanense]